MNDTLSKVGIIAIVDDDAPLREALGSLLKAAGFAIDTFASAEEFLASPDRKKMACLILDVRLPGMSGIELQRRLAESGDAIPVIFVSAHGDVSLREMVMKTGAAGFLNKPVRSDTLLRGIHSAIEKSLTEKHQ